MNEKRKPGGMVQRCIIVHRDGQGFGLTVSGDNPVFVQSIKEGSAAARAGVQEGDQIIKVNGTTVTNSNHLEVVRLIRSGSYVALTLLGKDNFSKTPTENKENSRPNSTGHIRSRSVGNNLGSQSGHPSSPPADSKKTENKINDLKRMLTLEHDLYKKLLDDYMKSPSQKAQQELADSQTRIHTVEQQLKGLTGSVPSRPAGVKINNQPWMRSPQPTGGNRVPPPGSNFHTFVTATPYPGYANHENGNMKSPTKLPNSNSSSSLSDWKDPAKRSQMDEEDGHQFPFQMPQPVSNINEAISDSAYSFDALFENAQKENLGGVACSNVTATIVSMEDDEFDFDEECITDHGPFINFETLKDRPAHLAVFLHYLMSNSNPVPLLFWLVTDAYTQEPGSGKDLRRWAYEVYSIFIGEGAPLGITISEPEEVLIEHCFEDAKLSDERIKSMFDVARSIIFIEVNEQLADFRNKRALGLGGLFGDHQLEDNLDRDKELRVIDQTLMPHLEALMGDNSSSFEQIERSNAIAAALATFLKQKGSGKTLEKCRSFVEKEKNSTFMPFRKKKPLIVNSHQFTALQYSNITSCDYCQKILRGIGVQGYQCSVCEMNVHKKCMESTELCTKKKQSFAPVPAETPQFDKRGEDTSADLGNTNSSFDGESGHGGSDKENVESPSSTPAPSDGSESKAKTIGHNIRPKVGQIVGRGVTRAESVKPAVPAKPVKPGTLSGGKTGMAGIYGPSPFKVSETTLTPESDEEFEDDSDLDVDTESVNWQSTVTDRRILRKLKSKELKRQEVIHELIFTERTHVRNLKVLFRVFYKPLLRKNIIPRETVMLIFPNLEELIEIHESLLKPMKELVKKSEVIESIGDILLDRFDGENGIKVREACAQFCRLQKHALLQLKKLQISKREVQQFMAKQETHEYCRRLKFTDIMASSHQRLVKYPLLLDSICKSTPPIHSDLKNVERCWRCCRDILNHVNNQIKMAEDKLRLEELSRIVEDRRVPDEKEEEGKFDITGHNLILEGELIWKTPNKQINLRVVLLEDILVLLQISDGGKLILKNHATLGATNDNKGHSPIIKLANVMARENAADKTSFFMIHTSFGHTGPQIYDLVTNYSADKKKWVSTINKAADLMKTRDLNAGRGRRDGIVTASSSSTSSPGKTKRKSALVNQKSSVDDDEQSTRGSRKATSPTVERLSQLKRDLASKDEQLKKLWAEKIGIIAEIRGEIIAPPKDEKDEKPVDDPKETKDLIYAAMNQVTQLTEACSSILTSTKDSSAAEQRNIVSDSTKTLQDHLESLLELTNRNLPRSTTEDADRKSSASKPPVKQLSESSALNSSASTSGIAHVRSYSSPVETSNLKSMSTPAVEIHSDEEKAHKVTDISPLDEKPTEVAGDLSRTPPIEKKTKDSTQLLTSPFKMIKKRPSDPCLDPNHSLRSLSGEDVKQVNRAASFSGFSNIHPPEEDE